MNQAPGWTIKRNVEPECVGGKYRRGRLDRRHRLRLDLKREAQNASDQNGSHLSLPLLTRVVFQRLRPLEIILRPNLIEAHRERVRRQRLQIQISGVRITRKGDDESIIE